METSRGALTLLAQYGSDSSDDDIPSGRVSTKRCLRNDDNYDSHTPKRLYLPSIITLNNKNKHVDDPTLHDGRTRCFAHERDSWATYVYIAYDINDGIEHVINNITHHLEHFKAVNDLHISLTKVIVLRHHWIESFTRTVKEHISHITCFMLMFDSLQVYCNEDRTRTFIGLHIKTGYQSLSQLVTILDQCLEEFRLPKFYEERKFHMSVAWCAGDHEEAVKTVLPILNQELLEIYSKYSDDNWYMYVNKLQCKVGNKYFTFSIT